MTGNANTIYLILRVRWKHLGWVWGVVHVTVFFTRQRRVMRIVPDMNITKLCFYDKQHIFSNAILWFAKLKILMLFKNMKLHQ